MGDEQRKQKRRHGHGRALFKNRLTYLGLAGTGILIAIAIIVPLLPLDDPLEQSPVDRFAQASVSHPLGRDGFGRDVLSRLVYATRVSIGISLSSVTFALVLGICLGVYAGYRGGWADKVITEGVNMLLAFPMIVLGILIMVGIGSGIRNVVVAIAVGLTVRFVRLARGSTLVIKEMVYVQAAVASGASDVRILGLHVIPNIVGNCVVSAALWTATAIRVESTLSFLGLGVQPPSPSWGNMVADSLASLLSAPRQAVYPCAAILFAVLSFNLLGDGLRDYLDPRAGE